MAMKRVTTREFLRNINSMTDPVDVYSRAELKGTWLPRGTKFSVFASTPEAIEETFKSVRRTIRAASGPDSKGDPA